MTKKAPTDKDLLLAERVHKVGIPTLYNGVRYRSRVEAKWAAFFDGLRWAFEYEPLDLEWYIPDFILKLPAGPIAVEVKGESQLSELRPYANKIVRSGWAKEFLIVGSTLHRSTWGDKFGPSIGLLAERDSSGDSTGYELGDAQTFFCISCGETAFCHADMSWRCRICGAYDGNGHIGNVKPDGIQLVWAEAGNRVQWKGQATT